MACSVKLRHEHDGHVMRPGDVAELQQRLVRVGLDWCVVGGWGVDALLRTPTRDHKDLDVLLPLTHLERILTLLAAEGFRLAYVWPESLNIPGGHPLIGAPMPSAFVVEHVDEREVDVHVYDDQESAVAPLWDTHRTLHPKDLTAAGEIDGVAVRCMTASMQLECHGGYELPPAHAADVLLLQRLVQPTQ